jgi:hypothetical protein
MKNLIKNSKDKNLLMNTLLIQQMANQLIHVCTANGLVAALASSTDKQGVPSLTYAIKYTEDGEAIFNGKATSATDAHFAMTMDAIRGRIVSELCPPAMRTAKPEKFGDSHAVISYWKRILIVEQNITNQHVVARAASDEIVKPKREAVWVGHSAKNEEVIRVPEGGFNEGWEKIDRVEFVHMGPLGMVAAVVFRTGEYKEISSLGDMISAAAQHRGEDGVAQASTAMAIPRPSINKGSSMSERFEDTMGSTTGTTAGVVTVNSATGTENMNGSQGKTDLSDKVIKFSRVFEVAGNTIGIPVVLNGEEFSKLPDQAKGDYLKVIATIAHGYEAGYFVTDVPELDECMGNFLCDAAESAIFDSEYRAEVTACPKENFDSFVTRTEFTAKLLCYTPELMVKLYGNVSPIQRSNMPKDVQGAVTVLELANLLGTSFLTVIKLLEKLTEKRFLAQDVLNRTQAVMVANKIGIRFLPMLATVKEVAEQIGVKVEEVSAFLDAYGYDATADTPLTADVVGMVKDRFPAPTEKAKLAKAGPRRRIAKSPDVPAEKEVKAEVKRITKAAAPARKPAAKKATTIKK